MRRPTLTAWAALAAPGLVFALDYDGTLVPIVERPGDARPDAEVLDLLARLASAPGHRVAILSGRPVETLAEWIGLPGLALIGTHGAEWRPPGGEPEPLLAPPDARAAAEAAAAALEAELAGIPGSQVEPKAHGVAAHYRRVPDADRPRWRRAFDAGRRRADGRFELHEGKCVLELRWPGVAKGAALVRARRLLGWEGLPVLALGDDRTDESTFATLGPDDLGVHVGEGPTVAEFAVPDVPAARALLGEVLRARTGSGAR
jgi:trehalose 6-phosphate synthase/phosphatase